MWHVIMDSNVYSYGTCFWICKRNMSRTINLNKSLIGFIVTLISHDKSNYISNVIILLWTVYSIHWSTYLYCIPCKIHQCIQRYLRYISSYVIWWCHQIELLKISSIYDMYKIEYRIKNMFSNSEGDFKPIWLVRWLSFFACHCWKGYFNFLLIFPFFLHILADISTCKWISWFFLFCLFMEKRECLLQTL